MSTVEPLLEVNVLPAEPPDSSPRSTASIAEGPRRSAVPLDGEDQADVPFEDGLVRSAAVGGVIGFTIVFVMVCAGLLLIDMDLAYVLPSAAFVAAFGGVGFGAMQAAALHRPPSG